MSDYLKRQNELRLNAWEEAKHLLDAAAAESRDLTAEENVIYDRISEDMDNRARVIEQITKDEERAQRLDVAAASVRTDEVAPAGDDDDAGPGGARLTGSLVLDDRGDLPECIDAPY